MGISLDEKWLLNIGELIPRKNQETLIRAVSKIQGTHLTIAGRGPLNKELSMLIEELGIANRVQPLGYRTDISDLCKSCDVFVFASFHEGLPVSIMEAMAGGLSVVCSQIRGNTDLIDNNGGELFDPYSVSECSEAIKKILTAPLSQFGHYNAQKVMKYEIEQVNEIVKHLYEDVYL